MVARYSGECIRWTSAIAMTLALISFAGCGGDAGGGGGGGNTGGGGAATGGSETTDGDSETADTTAKERPTVAFVTNQIADFWNIAKAGCLEAQKDFDVDVEVRMPAQATAAEQKKIVEDLVNRGIDGIAISPIDADNQTALVNEVAEKIPLITHDSDAPKSNRLMYIGMDNYRAGRMCGELVKKALPEGGEVMLFIGRLEQDNAKQRRQGVIDELLGRDPDRNRFEPVESEPIEGEKYTILKTLTDGGDQSDCKRKAEDALNTYKDVKAMVGLFEYNPPAILQAVNQANKLGEVKVIGFDENEVTLQAIRDGHCIGTVVQNPFDYGYKSVEMLVKVINEGESALPENREVDIPARTITKENVDAFEDDLKAKKGG